MGNTPLSELHCSHSSKSKRARIMSRPKRCNILDLNDDCCYHIYKFLSILDWCSLRDTCTRFRTISDYCFDRRSGSFKLRHISNTSGKVELSEVKRVLRTFGRYMKALSINQNDFVGNPNCNVLMLYVDRYCLSLVDLTIAHLGLTLATSEQCSRLFSNLQRLVIDEWEHWNEEAFSDCLPKCRSLTELELDGLFYIIGDKLGDSRMEFLKSFKMSYCLGFRYEAFKRFITLNCQLTQLKLADLFKDCLVSKNILEDIANSLPKLECLSLQLYTPFMKNALPITRMTLLKKLEIDLRRTDASIVNEMISCVAEMSTIEDLHLTSFTCTDESIGLLSSLKCLKILRLSGTKQLSSDMCKRLAAGLCGLSEIHISKCRKCNGTSFNEIKEFVLHIPNLKRIAFNMVYDGPRIAPEVFHSLAEIRNRQRAKEILLFFLDDKDIRHIRSEYKSNGMDGKIAEYGNVLKMLPLERDMMYIRRINIECEVDHPEYRIMRWCGVRCNNMPN